MFAQLLPQILDAVSVAAGQGLSIPLVYNSGGYDSVEILQLLDGVVDIYMPDAKYASDHIALTLSAAPHYTSSMKAAFLEMHRQVGDLVITDGLAVRGMIIRHLVLPGGLAGTEGVMQFIAREISDESYVNVMDQYRPAWHAASPGSIPPGYEALGRRITREEYRLAIGFARKAGLHRGLPTS